MREEELIRGVVLFNSGHFFAAHEVLEDCWRETPRHSRLRCHLQGLVQLAVAFHHQSTGNRVGARSVLERALHNVESAEESLPQVDWERLRGDLQPWREYLAEDRLETEGCPPELPKVLVRNPAR